MIITHHNLNHILRLNYINCATLFSVMVVEEEDMDHATWGIVSHLKTKHFFT